MARIMHFELAAENPERAAAFYKAAFGWDMQKWEGPMDYWMVTTGDAAEPGINGGMTRRSDLVEHTVVTIVVDDVDAALAAVAAHGGINLTQKMPVGDMGFSAYFRDSEGNVVGLFQPNMPM